MRIIGITMILWVFNMGYLCAQNVPFSRGINLTGWFQAADAHRIQFTKYTKKDFENIKSLGCDVIRLPINLHNMTTGAPDYELDPLFLYFLDHAVDWAESLDIYLILDNHTFDPSANTDPNIGTVLKKVWVQMAQHYKNRTDHVMYEVLNEPHGISNELWNAIQQQVIDTIRTVDIKHTIVVGPADWNSYRALDQMPVYDDDHLIYTFHFYDPFLFTHQGASWVNPSMEPLAGVPFPYDADSMPPLPDELKGTWIEYSYNDYPNTGNEEYVQQELDIAIRFRDTRNVPTYCGEFGVFMKNSKNSDRVRWYDVVREYLEANGISWTIWDYHSGFGLFEKGGNDMFEHDLNVPLLEALGLNVPEQTEYVLRPDSTGFLMYTDYIGKNIINISYTNGLLDFYSLDRPNNGHFCLKWADASQYRQIGFDFKPDKDLSRLVSEGYALDMIVRSDISDLKFDIRFIDTKTDEPGDHPWRMVYTIDPQMITPDSKWHHLFIPLSDFTEGGSWDDGWYNPEGKFDWTQVDRFEVSNEYDIFGEGKIWFDNIHVTNMDTARIFDDSVFIDPEITGYLRDELRDILVYPNPANNYLIIENRLDELLSLELSDLRGRVLTRKTFYGNAEADISSLASGIYFLRVGNSRGVSLVRKILKR